MEHSVSFSLLWYPFEIFPFFYSKIIKEKYPYPLSNAPTIPFRLTRLTHRHINKYSEINGAEITDRVGKLPLLWMGNANGKSNWIGS